MSACCLSRVSGGTRGGGGERRQVIGIRMFMKCADAEGRVDVAHTIEFDIFSREMDSNRYTWCFTASNRYTWCFTASNR